MTPAGADDPLAKGVLRYKQHGVALELATAEGLFSTAVVDPGTRFLLRRLAEPDLADVRSVLDVGCGYGPLGLWLGAAAPDRTVLAIDRDALAVEVTAANAVRNGIGARVTTTASLGYDDVAGQRVDLVVSNIPAKVGPEALRHLVLEAPGDRVAIVVVERLVPAVDDLLTDVELLDRRVTKGYASFVARARPPAEPPAPGFDRGVYGRGAGEFEAAGLRWTASTSYSLPEFDTLGHGTRAAAVVVAGTGWDGPVGVVGVGQGHLARVVELGGAATVLVDRDLLGLRTAAANLDVVPTLRHTARPDLAGCGGAVVALPEKEPVAVTAALLGAAFAQLPRGAPVVLHGRAVDAGRVLDLLARKLRRPLKEQVRHAISGFVAVRVTA